MGTFLSASWFVHPFRFAGYFPSVVGLFNLLLFTIQIRARLPKPNATDDFSGFLPKAATRFKNARYCLITTFRL